MHMLSLILAAEVYHCWEIFNMNHMRHEARRFPRSHRGFHVSAGQVARAPRVPARALPSAPAPEQPARECDGPGRPQLPRARPRESHQEFTTQNLSCHSEPF